MAVNTYFFLNDNILELQGLKEKTTGAFINNATVTVTLVDVDGTEIANETWPLTLVYVTASDGIYRATLQDVLTLNIGDHVVAQISATGNSLQGRWNFPIQVEERTSV